MAARQEDTDGSDAMMREASGGGLTVKFGKEQEQAVEIKRMYEAQPLNPLRKLLFRPLVPEAFRR